MLIKDVKGRMIFDSRGNPTVEATVYTTNYVGKAAAPSGASTGTHEAVELRDGGKAYHGKGVSKAVNNVRAIENIIRGMDAREQRNVDNAMITADGTRNKSKLGSNAIVAVSMAVARAAANGEGKELFEYLNPSACKLPIPMMNIINGGKHAGNNISIQEFMIVPHGAKSFENAMRMGSEIYHTLKNIITEKFGKNARNVGDEGGFAPPLSKTSDVLDLVQSAIDECKYGKKVSISLDCAASEFYKNGKYSIDGKQINASSLLEFYLNLLDDYNIFSIEDPFDEDDFDSFRKLNEVTKCRIVGDDLTVTNAARIQKALDMNAMDTLLLKVNQIGTLTEALEAASLAMNNGCGVIVSHRSGETCDTFIADLAVSLNCGLIKSGAPCRSERLSKYNRLLQIEYLLGSKAEYGL